ncbi:Di-copper centre-containing protein [Aspergillus sclerotiicarbonarius CBS 121057]|uniref:Di-copper centre-containing protein n=1 Tax=Aspergillus sclerotiicarbonarius (strain CBS 121057 / IBT 28362) TaxID=1448318 RepID=A0A319F2V9_ASPSB|nr:Di-copper centre-containing protein [Aspergillus sclerotiicarbonarius CBS 121057]
MVALKALSLGLLASQAWAVPTASQKATSTSASPAASSSAVAAAASTVEQLARHAFKVTTDNLPSSSNDSQACTLETLRIRRDWRSFSKSEKKAYIHAVLCLQNLPARTPSYLAAGAKTRYDDFLATHINQTLEIHYTGTFLAWHRYFTFEFEQALRDECGYRGDFPYWDWGADANDMEHSAVFDGSETSMSGNGAYIPNQGDIDLYLGNYPAIVLPPGSGGGCVTSGPFQNYTVNMGPAALSLPGGNTTSVANPLDYNPRCLKRSLTTAILQRYNTYPKIASLLVDNNDVWDFEMTMQGIPGSGSIGVHGAGHYSMGGDPGRDVYVSPGDPAFWHHHGMIDRVWWIWQNMDLEARQTAISGTGTFLNEPASANTTLDTVINVGYAKGRPRAMKELMSTTAGPFCYAYL